MNTIKSFFSMVWAEIKMFSRNKALLVIILSMSAIIILLMSMFANEKMKVNIALYSESGNFDSTVIYQELSDRIEITSIVEVESIQAGKDKVRYGEVSLFVAIDSSEGFEKGMVYINSTNVVGNTMNDEIFSLKHAHAYKAITKVLQDYGITLNDDYFKLIDSAGANVQYATWTQSLFAVEFGVCVAAVLMFGIAYSTSRNFESSVNKSMAYLPVGANRSLICKIIPYFVIGLLQLFILIPLGSWLFDIPYVASFGRMFSFCIIFVLACICTGLMFGMSKSQLIAVLLDLAMIIVPLLLIFMDMAAEKPLFLEIILNLSPIYPFVKLFNGLAFDGIVLWKPLVIIISQIVVYYSIAVLVYKKRVRA